MDPAVAGVLVGAGILAVVVMFNLAILKLLSWNSGWAAVAAVYPSPGVPANFGTRRRFQFARFGSWVNYNGCVAFVAAPPGLAVSVMFPVSLTHPPIFVPWADVTATVSRGFLQTYVEFRFAQTPDVPVYVREKLGRELLAAPGAPPLSEA